MQYTYISSPRGQISTCIGKEHFPNNKKWEVVPSCSVRVNIPYLMHDTRLCQIDANYI